MLCFFIRIASMVLLLLPFVRPPAHVLAKMRQSHGSDYAEGSVSLFDELIDVLFRLSDVRPATTAATVSNCCSATRCCNAASSTHDCAARIVRTHRSMPRATLHDMASLRVAAANRAECIASDGRSDCSFSVESLSITVVRGLQDAAARPGRDSLARVSSCMVSVVCCLLHVV